MCNNKIISLILVLALCLSFCACGSESSNQTESSASDEELFLETHDPGPYLDGYDLHYADNDGHDIKNSMAGFLQFDKNGIYTSGDTELDNSLRAILEDIIDPVTQTREEMLHIIYNYVRDNNSYSSSRYYETGATGWEKDATKELLERGSGNCFSYAALYVMLARCIGYQAEGVSGLFRGGQHGWAEMIVDGKVYYSDPQYEATANQEYGLFNVEHNEHIRQIQEYSNPNRDMSKVNDPIKITPINSDSTSSTDLESESDKFDKNSFEIATHYVNMDITSLIEAIGEPNSREYAQSCFYDNAEDGVLEYNGFTVYTYKFADREIIADVY